MHWVLGRMGGKYVLGAGLADYYFLISSSR